MQNQEIYVDENLNKCNNKYEFEMRTDIFMYKRTFIMCMEKFEIYLM